MKLHPFEMERWQSTWENQVKYNLSESGVHPLRVGEILDGNEHELLSQSLGYSQTNGTPSLRGLIAAIYDDATPNDILVTNGSSEANFLALWTLLERNCEIAVMFPNYMQVAGLAKTLQARVRPFWLKERQGKWILDIATLKKITRKRTKVIAVCNPNNPTGATLNAETIDDICAIARKTGAWILSDEVYRGAEISGKETPTFWNRYDKVIINSGLSKAYGLPGLRLGWIVTKKSATKLWAYHDYTTIGPNAISDYLAQKVLQPDTRAKILSRTRKIINENLAVVTNWVSLHGKYLSFVPPKAGAIALVKYAFKVNSTEIAERLLKEESTLVVPGDHLRMDHYLRLGFGNTQDNLSGGLTRVGNLLTKLANKYDYDPTG